MKVGRREFLRDASYAAAALALPSDAFSDQNTRLQSNSSGVPSFGPPYRHSLQRTFGKYAHDELSWYRLRGGLDFARIKMYNDGTPVDSLAVVRADPEANRFQVFHDGKNLKNVERWQDATGADVMFNSSYYGYNMASAYQILVDPVALIIIDGKMKGPRVNKAAHGMFVAEPRDDRKPRAKIIDFKKESYDYRKDEWRTGVQSWPMILDADGATRFGRSNWYANRTVLCDDRDGNILAITTEGGFFPLGELGRFLRESKLNVKNALNMDGGYEADMTIKMPALHYVSYGQWETQGKKDISVPGARIVLPAVVGIFPR
ncbi:MAG: phosphodiester glycosidase family protein [Candidatus Aenigmatarchaeota archaeon]